MSAAVALAAACAVSLGGWLSGDEPSARGLQAREEAASSSVAAPLRSAIALACTPSLAAPSATAEDAARRLPPADVLAPSEERRSSLWIEGEVVGANEVLGELSVEAIQVAAPQRVVVRPLPGLTFRLNVPAAGHWRVRVTGAQGSSPWVVADAKPDATPRLRLDLRAHATLRGRVRGPQGESLAGARVALTDSSGRERTIPVGPGGEFQARVSRGEPLLVVASREGLAPAFVRSDGTRLDHEVLLRLDPLIPLKVGRFLGPAGSPLAGALSFEPRVPDPHAHAKERLPFEAELDRAGRPSLSGLPDGVWVVSLHEPAPDELRAWVREVDTAEDVPTLELPTGVRGRLAGRVLGAPQGEDEVQVELRPESLRGAFRFLAARYVAPTGAFEFAQVPAGRYRVRATWEGGSSQAALVEVREGEQAWTELQPQP